MKAPFRLTLGGMDCAAGILAQTVKRRCAKNALIIPCPADKSISNTVLRRRRAAEWSVFMAYLIYGIGIICVVILILSIMLVAKRNAAGADAGKFDQLRREIADEVRSSRLETASAIQENIKLLSEVLSSAQRQTTDAQDKRLSELNEQLTARNDALRKTVADMTMQLDERFKAFSVQNEQKSENMRVAVETRLRALQEDNAKQLEQMRGVVDEKLQKTLEERISHSFQLVSERLEQVYKGLGEMQTLASGVGDLKKVLSGVKTRGILGEIQLGAILEQILSPEQYETNVVTKKGSRDPVEYAVCLPGDGEQTVYLPIDAKFPADVYAQLQDAYESGSQEAIALALAGLERSIRLSAKTIRDKYVDPPHTTDFGIMFLPFEGLYAEVVRHSMVETLQRDYKINIAGPTTMAALLNSLQMGFRTLAIQKHSGEVWRVLGAVKTEFDKFETVLQATQNRLEQANKELDKLVGVRTRQIRSKLRGVTGLSETETSGLLLDEESETEPTEA